MDLARLASHLVLGILCFSFLRLELQISHDCTPGIYIRSRDPNFSPCIYMARTLATSQFSQSFLLCFETLSYPRLNLIHCVPEDDLELTILLPSSPECRDYKHAPPSLDYMLLRIKLGSSCLLKKLHL